MQACNDWQYINETLEHIKGRCLALAYEIDQEETTGKTITYEEAKARYTTDPILLGLRGVRPSRRVVYTAGVFEFIRNEIEARTEEANTKWGRNNTLNCLQEYHEQQYKGEPMYWECFTAEYLADFVRYLQEVKGQNPTTANKALKNAKVFHRWGVEAGKASELGAIKKLKEEASRKVYVSPEELEQLDALRLETGSTRASVRDWFLIACGTGLRVSDLLRLTPKHIHTSSFEGVSEQIEIKMKKTGHEVIIPLIVPCMVSTLERLGGKFPKRLEPQTLNREIKQLCKQAGLTSPTELEDGGRKLEKWEAVTMHTARHTFVTLALMRDIRPELVAEITGHKSLGVLDKHYNRQTQADKVRGFVQAFRRSEERAATKN